MSTHLSFSSAASAVLQSKRPPSKTTPTVASQNDPRALQILTVISRPIYYIVHLNLCINNIRKKNILCVHVHDAMLGGSVIIYRLPDFSFNARANTRGNNYKLQNQYEKIILFIMTYESIFSARFVNIKNSLPNSVVDACTVNAFKARLHKFWQHQSVKFDFTAYLTGTGNWSEELIKWYCSFRMVYYRLLS